MSHWRPRDDNCRRIKSFCRPAAHIFRYGSITASFAYTIFAMHDVRTSRSIVVCVVCLWSSTIGAERLHCANAKHQWPPWNFFPMFDTYICTLFCVQLTIDCAHHRNYF